MESIEKVRILQSAVDAAEGNGFNFFEWYNKQFNIIPRGKISKEDRINHMCYLGIEDVLIFNQKFIKALNKKGWKDFLQSTVISKRTHMYCLWELLFDNGILNE